MLGHAADVAASAGDDDEARNELIRNQRRVLVAGGIGLLFLAVLLAVAPFGSAEPECERLDPSVLVNITLPGDQPRPSMPAPPSTAEASAASTGPCLFQPPDRPRSDSGALVAVVLGLLAVVAVLWWLIPRSAKLPRRPKSVHTAPVAVLVRDRKRYRVQPFGFLRRLAPWIPSAGATLILVLNDRPGRSTWSADLGVVSVAVVYGGILHFATYPGYVSVSSDDVIVRSSWRRSRWAWHDVDHFATVTKQRFRDRTSIEYTVLTVRLRNGHGLTTRSISWPDRSSEARVEGLVAVLEQHRREARNAASSGGSAFPVT